MPSTNILIGYDRRRPASKGLYTKVLASETWCSRRRASEQDARPASSFELFHGERGMKRSPEKTDRGNRDAEIISLPRW